MQGWPKMLPNIFLMSIAKFWKRVYSIEFFMRKICYYLVNFERKSILVKKLSNTQKFAKEFKKLQNFIKKSPKNV